MHYNLISRVLWEFGKIEVFNVATQIYFSAAPSASDFSL